MAHGDNANRLGYMKARTGHLVHAVSISAYQSICFVRSNVIFVL
jgi:hypothetical protein